MFIWSWMVLYRCASASLYAFQLYVCGCVCDVLHHWCICMQDDVQSVDPIDISLNQLELNEVSTACSGYWLWFVSIIAPWSKLFWFSSFCVSYIIYCHFVTGPSARGFRTRWHAVTSAVSRLPRSVSSAEWHQLGHMQVCTSLQTDNHARTQLLIQAWTHN